MKKLILLVIAIVSFYGCTGAPSPQNGNPDWVDGMIADFQNQPLGNPPESIYRYEFNGETVYYVPPQCCDQYGNLYDSKGNVICHPDGGLTGKGDGRCPEFSKQAKNGQLIWKDNRSSNGS